MNVPSPPCVGHPKMNYNKYYVLISMPYVRSPISDALILVGGPTYRKIVRSGKHPGIVRLTRYRDKRGTRKLNRTLKSAKRFNEKSKVTPVMKPKEISEALSETESILSDTGSILSETGSILSETESILSDRSVVQQVGDTLDCFKRENIKYCCQKGCFGGFELKEFINAGATGTVYVTCLQHRCGYAIKLVPIDVPIPGYSDDDDHPSPVVTEEDFAREVKFVRMMSYYDIGPTYIADGLTAGVKMDGSEKLIRVAYVVTDRWATDLDAYNKRFPELVQQQKAHILEFMSNLAHRLLNINLYLCDLHPGNMVVKLDNENLITHLRFIDFGVMIDNDDGDLTVFDMLRWVYDHPDEDYRSGIFTRADVKMYSQRV